MTYTQHVMSCTDAAACGVVVTEIHADGPDPACTVILCTDEDNAVVWHSHAHQDVDPAHRLNPDVPAQDWRA